MSFISNFATGLAFLSIGIIIVVVINESEKSAHSDVLDINIIRSDIYQFADGEIGQLVRISNGVTIGSGARGVLAKTTDEKKVVGGSNIVVGTSAGVELSDNASGNILLGYYVAPNLVEGENNIGIGNSTFSGLSSGSDNISIGNDVKFGSEVNNCTVLGGDIYTDTNSNDIILGNSRSKRIVPGYASLTLGSEDKPFEEIHAKKFYIGQTELTPGTNDLLGNSVEEVEISSSGKVTTINGPLNVLEGVSMNSTEITDVKYPTTTTSAATVASSNLSSSTNARRLWDESVWKKSGKIELTINEILSRGVAIPLGHIIVSSEGRTILTDENIITTDFIPIKTGTSFTSIDYSPKLDLLCAVGNGGSEGRIFTYNFTDIILSWTEISGTNAYHLRSVVWAEKLNIFCAVGQGVSVIISPDLNAVKYDISPNLKTVIWSQELSLFCALEENGGIRTSKDGQTWGIKVSEEDVKDVVWAPELGIFCAVVVGAGRNLISSDGINWVGHSTTSIFSSVTWSPELGLFCATYSHNSTQTSKDGINWDQAYTKIVNLSYVTWCPSQGMFMAFSLSPDETFYDLILSFTTNIKIHQLTCDLQIQTCQEVTLTSFPITLDSLTSCLFITGSTDIDLTLPLANAKNNGLTFTIVNRSSVPQTLNTTSGNTFSLGATTKILTAGSKVTLIFFKYVWD